MQFLFVDDIDAVSDRAVAGRMHLGPDGPYVHRSAKGDTVGPGYIAESIGQLASWHCVSTSGFRFKPVFLFCPTIEFFAPVPAALTVHLEARIERFDDESFVFSGSARVDGEVVARLDDCHCLPMPLERLEDSELVRERFLALSQGSWRRQAGLGNERISFSQVLVAAEVATRTFDVAFDDIGFIYRDHFPNQPVTPVVVLNEVVHSLVAETFGLAKLDAIRELKIRSFVAPGESFQVRLGEPQALAADKDKQSVHVELAKKGRTIMRGRYDFHAG